MALIVSSAALLGAVCFWLWPAEPPPTPPVEQAAAVSARPPAPALPVPRALVHPPTAVTVTPKVMVEESPAPEAPAAVKRPRSPLDDLRERVMTGNPDIAQYRKLQRKVLLKPEERERLQALYKDREQIEAAKRDLLAAGEKTFTDEGQFKRLYRVEYLGMGLEWKDNPERQSLLKDVEGLILAKNIQPEQELELRRSLAGDKVELFMILLHNDRPRAEALLASARGTPLEALLVHAQTRFDALWALGRRQQQ